MKSKLHLADLLILVIILLPYLYLLQVYPTLPSQVPTHFKINGGPDAMGSKSTLWFIISLTAGISILLYLLLRFLPEIDPKKKAGYSASAFNKIGVAIVLLLFLINCFIITAAQKGAFNFANLLPVVSGIFFAFMGNIMHSIKPNYFAGIRTPWTLESDETWRKTHQFGGKLWFFGGIILAVSGLILSPSAELYILIGIICLLTILPIVYSYAYFKSHRN